MKLDPEIAFIIRQNRLDRYQAMSAPDSIRIDQKNISNSTFLIVELASALEYQLHEIQLPSE